MKPVDEQVPDEAYAEDIKRARQTKPRLEPQVAERIELGPEPNISNPPAWVEEEPEQETPPRNTYADIAPLDIVNAINAEPPELDFVLPGLLVGTIGAMVSPGGAGKSMLALELAVSIAGGWDAFGLIKETVKQGPVIIVAIEDPREVLQRRIHSLGLQYNRDTIEALQRNLIILPVSNTRWAFGTITKKTLFTPSDALRDLKRRLDEVKPRLLIIDTLNRCLGGQIDENDNAAMGRIISEIEALLITPERRTATLVLHHANKGALREGTGAEQYAARGASALTDNARFQCNLVAMDAKEAGERGISDEERGSWIQLVASKVNYSMRPAPVWLHRGNNGVLVPQEPPAKKPKGSRVPGEWVEVKATTPRDYAEASGHSDAGTKARHTKVREELHAEDFNF